MKALIIDATEKTPEIVLDPSVDKFEISGKSIPSDAERFFTPVLDWLETYMANPNRKTCIKFNLEFFNISSSKRILFILYRLNEMVEEGHNVSVEWCYAKNDDDMLEVGQDYAFMVKVPFQFTPVQYKQPALSYA